MYEILCERDHDELFYNKKRVNGKHYDSCVNLDLFHNKYPIDNDQSMSNVFIVWRRYEHINYTTSSSDALSKQINLYGKNITIT